VARARLTTRRLLGIDRSGPPPPETRRGQPLRPWTLPNVVGFLRAAAVPVFLVLALDSGDGRIASATVTFCLVAGADYLDGLLARVTGQYSRLGTILDPLVDRALVLAGAVVCWHFELLPRWALAVLAGRELFMLVASQVAFRKGLDLEINMVGRLAVWPTMFALWLAMVSVTWVAGAFLYLGIAMTLAATFLYIRDGRRALATRTSSYA
jgi:cardiolipin synthase (CMP-forming)